jgi:hypothetical protein
MIKKFLKKDTKTALVPESEKETLKSRIKAVQKVLVD